MTTLNHSPAEILAQHLYGTGVVTDPVDEGAWPAYVGHLDDSPDDAVCVYDTTGTQDGRDQNTGETFDHPGIQVRVRGFDYVEAYKKAAKLEAELDKVKQSAVTLYDSDGAGTTYNIHAATRTTPAAPLKQPKQEEDHRPQFTVNAKLTITITA